MMHLVEDSNNSLAIQFLMETALRLKEIPFKWPIKFSNPTTTQIRIHVAAKSLLVQYENKELLNIS